jgi:hypothetical protein
MSNLITPKDALHQSSWEVISKRFDLNDISTTRSLLEEAHNIILRQDRLIDAYEPLLKKYQEENEDLAYQLKGANFWLKENL